MNRAFIIATFLVVSLNTSAQTQALRPSQILSGYFIKKENTLFFFRDPDAISPSIKVNLSSDQTSKICIGGVAKCSEVQILCAFEGERDQQQCNVKKILPSRNAANAELRIWNKFFL